MITKDWSSARIAVVKVSSYLILVICISIPIHAIGGYAVINPDELFAKGMKQFSDNRFDEAISLFTQAEKEYEVLNNMRQIIGCRLGIATCFFAKGNIEKALEFNESAMELHVMEMKDDQRGYDQIKENIALCKELIRREKH
ncbi:hypothetical protein [Chryseolinea soli]|nr:hypothetical protein [Chryseolinea soli]